MRTFKKIFVLFIGPLAILVFAYLIVDSISQPVRFNKELEMRKAVVVERLKDIRTLQVAYKGVFGAFSNSIDTLIDFYNNGQMTIIRQVGSWDDSLAVARKQVYRDSVKIAVQDTLFNHRPNFHIDSLRFIPFSGKREFIVETATRQISGISVPLFAASAPYEYLLSGMDKQLIINLIAEQKDVYKRYEGVRVGSIEAPNNNAGNWE
jgi:hypothetical protein